MQHTAHSRFSNMELINYPDCTNLKENGKCICLNVLRCDTKGCAFMKTRKRQEADIKRTYIRLTSLDETTQDRISKKYYCGKRPWLARFKGKQIGIKMEEQENV